MGPDLAATLLITAGGNKDRTHREASFAALCGVNPLPASSGKTNRHRLNLHYLRTLQIWVCRRTPD